MPWCHQVGGLEHPIGRLPGYKIRRKMRLPGSNPVPGTNPGSVCGFRIKRPSVEQESPSNFLARRPNGCAGWPKAAGHKAGGRRGNRPRRRKLLAGKRRTRTTTERGDTQGVAPFMTCSHKRYDSFGRTFGSFSCVRKGTPAERRPLPPQAANRSLGTFSGVRESTLPAGAETGKIPLPEGPGGGRDVSPGTESWPRTRSRCAGRCRWPVPARCPGCPAG